MISKMIEKKRLEGGISEGVQKIESIKTMKRLWIGMLGGFIVAVIVGVMQFIVRFGYFTLLQEIGAVVFGLVGAVLGGLCGIMKWRRSQRKEKRWATRNNGTKMTTKSKPTIEFR